MALRPFVGCTLQPPLLMTQEAVAQYDSDSRH